MRLIIISGILAGFLLLPALADLRQFDLPYRGLIGIPAVLLEYPVVVLHELGHFLTRLFFGYITLPDFDFEHGGGIGKDFKANNILLYAVWGAFLVGFFLFLLKREYRIALGISVLAGLHIAMAFAPGHAAMIYYMGHGAELLAASYLIVHAARGEAVGGVIRQYISMVLGLYLMGKNVILSLGLGIGPAVMRHAYAAQKGVHVAWDFRQIAEILDDSVKNIALYSLGVTCLCAAAVVFLAVYLPAHERLGSIK